MKRFIEGEGNPVRIVDVFVDEIDLQSLGDGYGHTITNGQIWPSAA